MMLMVQKYDVEIKYVQGKKIPQADALSRISPCLGYTIGWPNTRSDCPTHLYAFWDYRDELTVADGVILKGTGILIPKTLQADVLQQLHYAHQEAEKCKLRAKGSLFWVNINRDIEEMVKSCAPCQHNPRMNLKEPLMPHDIPQKPWQTLGCDSFFLINSSY